MFGLTDVSVALIDFELIPKWAAQICDFTS